MQFFAINFLLLASFSSVVTAQFGFFDHMFGNSQQQQRQQPGSHGGNFQWNMHADAVPCSSYLCPDSLACVGQPSECPCPNVEDTKCVIPDAQDAGAGTVVCVRGEGGCAAVERLSHAYSK
ncbi:hypothetical protein HYDPIDRAFT_79223 [Hydnomerulius pinastri MD-312]|nr:hypothetical protein HYDPIDRAFT_79223 [Hydnomerulius pinastri MD-312]